MVAKQEEAKKFPMKQSSNPIYGVNPHVQNMPKPTSSNHGWRNSRGFGRKRPFGSSYNPYAKKYPRKR